MHLSECPEEVLRHIIGSLHRRRDRSDLLRARLVCRSWNALASHHVFHTLELIPKKTAITKWNEMTSWESVQSAVRNVIIQSTVPDTDYGPGQTVYDSEDGEAWSKWESHGEYPEYTSAMGRIDQLPLLHKISINFTTQCRGPRGTGWDDDYELSSTRENTLKAAFLAIQQRTMKPKMSAIRSLTIENLQNLKIPDLTSSDLFKLVMKDITQLHLNIATECNESGPDWDVYQIERVEFEPSLHEHWLSPVANQLTALSIHCSDPWGTIPGVFHGRGLVFPHLKKLHLGNFAISHHDHLDWVLAQTSLQHLRLDNCCIVSHIRAEASKIAEWKVATHDWKKLLPSSYGFRDEEDAVYYFPGTWEQMFDKIRTQLPHLAHFECYLAGAGPRFDICDVFDPALFIFRYFVFDIGICPSPWQDPAYHSNGEINFGDRYNAQGVAVYNPKPVNRSEETWHGDQRAFGELVDDVRERCRRQ